MPYLLRNVDTGAYFAGYSDNAAGYTSDEAKAYRFESANEANFNKCSNEMVVYRPYRGVPVND